MFFIITLQETNGVLCICHVFYCSDICVERTSHTSIESFTLARDINLFLAILYLLLLAEFAMYFEKKCGFWYVVISFLTLCIIFKSSDLIVLRYNCTLTQLLALSLIPLISNIVDVTLIERIFSHEFYFFKSHVKCEMLTNLNILHAFSYRYMKQFTVAPPIVQTVSYYITIMIVHSLGSDLLGCKKYDIFFTYAYKKNLKEIDLFLIQFLLLKCNLRNSVHSVQKIKREREREKSWNKRY